MQDTSKKSQKPLRKAHFKKDKETTIKKGGQAPKVPTAELFDTSGKKQGTLTLPQEIFGAQINNKLLSQAIHVYFTNSAVLRGSTKTRAEIRGGGTKPWRQKGTGRARAGSIRSPLWVGGGVSHGPKFRNVLLALPKKMRTKALTSALSSKARAGSIKVISNIEKIEPKTKKVAAILQKLNVSGASLFVISEKIDSPQNIRLATRNIKSVSCETAQNLNTYEVIKSSNIFFSKESLDALSNRFNKAQSKVVSK